MSNVNVWTSFFSNYKKIVGKHCQLLIFSFNFKYKLIAIIIVICPFPMLTVVRQKNDNFKILR